MTPSAPSARLGWDDRHASGAPPPAAPAARRWRWWQWPHLLNLDAPAVAVTWLWWWASRQGVRLPADRYAILGLCVWAIYVADHVADASKADARALPTARHLFHAVHRPGLITGLAVTLAGLAVAAWLRLPARQFCGGSCLVGLVALYYGVIHHAPRVLRPSRPWVPKEAVVGVIFALGTCFFLIGAEGAPMGGLLFQGALFGALCFLNCALITIWERRADDRQDEASLLRAFPWLAANLNRGAAGLVVVPVVAAFVLGDIGPLPVALSAGALWLLDRRREPVGVEALRVLADVVLMTPPLVAAVCR